MKEQCKICGSLVEDVSGVCPVCGAPLGNSQEAVHEDSRSENTGKLRSDMRLESQQTPPGNNTYGGTSGVYMQGMPQGNVYTDSIPYNYQNPYQNPYQTPPGNVKKKKLFSVLSIVLAILALLTACCVDWLSAVCSLAALVLGIIALVKKQIKVPAILGLVFGGIALIFSGIMVSMNLMMKSVINTDIPGIFEQCFDAEMNGSTKLEGISFVAPDTYSEYYLYSDGTFSDKSGRITGQYENYSYMDSQAQNIIDDKAVYAMSEGYEIKDVTCLTLVGTTGVSYYVFAVPEGYMPGDVIYYIDGTSMDSYRFLPVNTEGLSGY